MSLCLYCDNMVTGNRQYNCTITICPQTITIKDTKRAQSLKMDKTPNELYIFTSWEAIESTKHLFKIKWFNALGNIKETSGVISEYISNCYLCWLMCSSFSKALLLLFSLHSSFWNICENVCITWHFNSLIIIQLYG